MLRREFLAACSCAVFVGKQRSQNVESEYDKASGCMQFTLDHLESTWKDRIVSSKPTDYINRVFMVNRIGLRDDQFVSPVEIKEQPGLPDRLMVWVYFGTPCRNFLDVELVIADLRFCGVSVFGEVPWYCGYHRVLVEHRKRVRAARRKEQEKHLEKFVKGAVTEEAFRRLEIHRSRKIAMITVSGESTKTERMDANPWAHFGKPIPDVLVRYVNLEFPGIMLD